MLNVQGYMQVDFLVSILLAFLVFRLDDRFHLRPTWKEFALAGLLALLLAAILRMPFLHFLPNFGKPDDPEFNTPQPLEYQPLNLVIREHEFFGIETLGKIP